MCTPENDTRAFSLSSRKARKGVLIFVAYAQIVDNMNDDIVEPPTWYAAACQPNTAAPTPAHFADCLTDFAWCCAQAASEKGAAPRCPPEKLTSISAALGIDTIVERKNH